jgi:hypothetical protein
MRSARLRSRGSRKCFWTSCKLMFPFSRRNAMGEGARRADEGLSPRVLPPEGGPHPAFGHLLPSSGREKGLVVSFPFSRRIAMGEGARRADEGLSPRVPPPEKALIRPAGHLLPSSGREKGLVVRLPFSRRNAMGEGAQRADEGFSPRALPPERALIRPSATFSHPPDGRRDSL